jgi:hypothetical protein
LGFFGGTFILNKRECVVLGKERWLYLIIANIEMPRKSSKSISEKINILALKTYTPCYSTISELF